MRFSNLILLTILIAMLLAPPGEVRAQDLPTVQEINGSLAPGQVDVFLINGLKASQTLDAFMETRSGNLDPILFIVAADENLAATLESFQEAVAELAASSAQPLLDLPALRDQYTLAWNDDGGSGYSAALQFNPPRDGDYLLVAGSSLSAAGRSTAGNYRLLIGLDALQVLDGTAEPNGAGFAVQNQAALATHLVQ